MSANNSALRAALNASRMNENRLRAAEAASSGENNSANANLQRVLRESAELHAQQSQITASEAARLAKAEKDNEEMAVAASLESQKREAALRDSLLREQRAREASELHAAIERSKVETSGAVAAANSAPLPADWTEHQNAASGKKYYYKAKTGVSQWERPVDELPAAAAPAPAPTAAAANSSSLPDGWEIYSNEEGTPYYYKATTGVSQWERPTRRRKRQRRSARHRRTLRR